MVPRIDGATSLASAILAQLELEFGFSESTGGLARSGPSDIGQDGALRWMKIAEMPESFLIGGKKSECLNVAIRRMLGKPGRFRASPEENLQSINPGPGTAGEKFGRFLS